MPSVGTKKSRWVTGKMGRLGGIPIVRSIHAVLDLVVVLCLSRNFSARAQDHEVSVSVSSTEEPGVVEGRRETGRSRCGSSAFLRVIGAAMERGSSEVKPSSTSTHWKPMPWLKRPGSSRYSQLGSKRVPVFSIKRSFMIQSIPFDTLIGGQEFN